ncbi:RHS repeat-associated core domain-containing protein [Lysinibacillus sphaericus]
MNSGDKDFITFRYQEQYDDVEIGLYYNRFRYYDPVQGNYTLCMIQIFR